MPPKAKPRKPRPAGHTFPGRQQISLLLSDQTVGILHGLCESKSAEYAARGVTKQARLLRSEVITELLYQAAARLAAHAASPSV